MRGQLVTYQGGTYVISENEVSRLDPATGKALWTYTAPEFAVPVGISDWSLYRYGDDPRKTATFVDLQTGEPTGSLILGELGVYRAAPCGLLQGATGKDPLRCLGHSGVVWETSGAYGGYSQVGTVWVRYPSGAPTEIYDPMTGKSTATLTGSVLETAQGPTGTWLLVSNNGEYQVYAVTN